MLIIADLHNYMNNSSLRKRLVLAISEAKANIIMIAGDIYNYGKYWLDDTKLMPLKNFIKEISKDAYVCITLGNHDLIGINDKNKQMLLQNFYQLKEINENKVYPLFNDQVVIDNMEIIGYVPRNELVQKEGLKMQIHGLAHDEFIKDYHSEGIKYKTDKIKIFLGHDPHLIAASENGIGLGDLTKCDYFITGHLHDGYKCYFKLFNNLSMNISKGMKNFMYDKGYVEQPLWILDKNGHKIWHLWPPVLGKTNLCRGIVYFDDDAMIKYWQASDNQLYENKNSWQKIKNELALKDILANRLHAMLISEGINPGFLPNEKDATINIIDVVSDCQ